ncbi:kinase-like domain-containing protein [Amanita rubescens]|nr:kinase-like domain-containing protein [Amanita rubescens]
MISRLAKGRCYVSRWVFSDRTWSLQPFRDDDKKAIDEGRRRTLAGIGYPSGTNGEKLELDDNSRRWLANRVRCPRKVRAWIASVSRIAWTFFGLGIIASINPTHLEELALTTRRQFFNGLPPKVSCIASTSPRAGSYNIVYKLSFSDGIQWAIRIPAEGDVRKPSRVRSFYLDIVTQRFISSRMSIPIPRIHYWSLDSSNILSRPFVIMDFIPGTNLSKLWNDRNWITDQKREKIFEQIAGWMTELSALEFDQIGCLDWDEASGTHHIVPFPDSRRISDSSILAILQLFLSALPDMTLDGPPFTLCPPDFNSQNVLLDDDGIVTGIIDWDGVRTLPRQGGAAAYPTWLTEDWVPLSYRWKKDASPEDNMHYDSPTELGLVLPKLG